MSNSISWYQEKEFLISRIQFLDIKNSISWYQEIINISWYQEFDFLISIIRILDIKKSYSWYKKYISWYQEFDFLTSINNTHFLISKNRIQDDIKKSFLDIKKSISSYQEMYSEAPFYYLLRIFFDINLWIHLKMKFISWYQLFDVLI